MKIINLLTGEQNTGIAPHAATHHAGGTDTLSAEDIGARPIGIDIDWGEIADAPDFGEIYRAISTPIDWSEIQGKPATYPPAAHSHPVNDAGLTPTIANNTVFVISGLTIGMLFVYARNSAYGSLNCILTYRVALGGNFIRFILNESAFISTALGIPTGTTGITGNLTFFGGNNDGKIYLENRTGGNIALGYHALNG